MNSYSSPKIHAGDCNPIRVAAVKAKLLRLLVGGMLLHLGTPVRATVVTDWDSMLGGTITPAGAGYTQSGGYTPSNPYHFEGGAAGNFSSLSLANIGDSLTLTGQYSTDSISAMGSSEFLRVGLYNTNGSSGSTGWDGYYITNLSQWGSWNVVDASNQIGPFKQGESGNFYGSLDGGTFLTDANNPLHTGWGGVLGDATFSLTLTRIASGLEISWDLEINGAGGYSSTGTVIDTNPLGYDFNAAGIWYNPSWNNDADPTLGAVNILVSNVDVTYTAVPEPSGFQFGAIGAVALFSIFRRRKSQLVVSA